MRSGCKQLVKSIMYNKTFILVEKSFTKCSVFKRKILNIKEYFKNT